MLSGWSLKTRLLSGYGISFIFMVGITAWGLYMQSIQSKTIKYLSSVSVAKLDALGEMRVNSMGAVRNVTDLAIPDLNDDLTREFRVRLNKRIKGFDEAFARFRSLDLTAEEKKLCAEMDEFWGKIVDPSRKVAAMAGDHTPETHAKVMGLLTHDIEEAMDAFTLKIRALDEFVDKADDVFVKKASDEVEFGFWMSVIASLSGVVLSLAVGFLISSSISREIMHMIEKITLGADKIAGASGLVSESAHVLSDGVTEQASALQETAASIDEISAMVTRNSENASVSIEKSSASREAVQEGSSSVKTMLQSMEDIATSNKSVMSQMEHSNAQISEITKVISEIANKTKIINDIVFQTKLLSFNASVEAARAGEHGKGFAVVAEEVGNLAQMSGNAALEISTMLESSIKKVEGIVTENSSHVEKLLGESKRRVEGGAVTARRCGDVLTHIERSISDLDKMVQEIAQASGEQATGVGEISRAMNQLNQVTQQNSIASQKSAAVAVDLNTDVQDIRAQVSRLEKLVYGSVQNSIEGDDRVTKGRVIQIRKSKSAAPVKGTSRKVVGSDTVPEESDPRFQKV